MAKLLISSLAIGLIFSCSSEPDLKDNDKDGFTNFDEVRANTDINDKDSYPSIVNRIRILNISDDKCTLINELTNKKYELQESEKFTVFDITLTDYELYKLKKVNHDNVKIVDHLGHVYTILYKAKMGNPKRK